jgi:phage terminase large subunit
LSTEETQSNVIQETKVFVTNLKALFLGYRLIANKGGTWSGKTFGFLAALAVFLYKSKTKRRATIIGQTSDELRDGAYKDWEVIMDMIPVGKCINKSSRIWKVGISTIQFQSLDKPGKAKSGKRDIVFVNEANHISWEIIKHLLLRSNVFIFDWNPSSKYWFQSKLSKDLGTVYKPFLFTKTTYKDNPACPQDQVNIIESLQGADYDIYAKGDEARRESLIYHYQNSFDPMPQELTNMAGFLDFGFTNDVTAFGEAGIIGDEIHIKEHIYKNGLLARDIDRELKQINWAKWKPIICDNIPSTVAELKAYGWNLIETKKFNGSVRYGINVLRQYKLISHNSASLDNEFDEYEWLTKDGEIITPEVPIDRNNHLLDGLRYYGMKYASAKVLKMASSKRIGFDNLT